MWITLDQIECLQAVKREGSVTAAAKKMNRAKSAIHYALKKLEEQVGFELVNTKSYRGSLTFKGEQFLLKADKLLQNSEELKEDVHRIATGVETRIAISASAIFSLDKFIQVIHRVQDEFPKTEVVFHREILSGEKMLRQGLVDISVFESPSQSDEFEQKVIDKVRMHLLISSAHPFLQLPKEEQTQERLFAYPQVVQRSTIPDDDLRGVYHQSKRWTVSDLSAKREIILGGLGWGRLPEHEVAEDLAKKKIVCLDFIEEPFYLNICIARRKNIEHGQVSQAIWDYWPSQG